MRPFTLDLFDILLPLAATALAFLAGHNLHRLPGAIRLPVIILSVCVVLILGVSYFVIFPEPISATLWHVGGEAMIACLLAVLLLGVVWSVRGRSTSTGFLRVLVGLVALINVLNSGGRLWWRLADHEAWQNTPNAEGGLTQTTGWTCSPATAAMLLHHHGIKTSEGEMAYFANTSYLGTDFYSIARALTLKGRSRGLVARFMLADYDACSQQPVPFLACVRIPGVGSHAVLVLRAHHDRAELIDPRFGYRQTVMRAMIEPQWEGKIILLAPE